MKIPTAIIPILNKFTGEGGVVEYADRKLFAVRSRLGVAVNVVGNQRETRKKVRANGAVFFNVFRFPVAALRNLWLKNTDTRVSQTDFTEVVEGIQDEPFIRPDAVLLRNCPDRAVSTIRLHAHELQAVVDAAIAASGKPDVVIKFEFKDDDCNAVRFSTKGEELEGFVMEASFDDWDGDELMPEPARSPVSV